MKKQNKDNEPVFSSKEEELKYRMRDVPLDYKKLALARISIALEDVLEPPIDLPLYTRRESFNFLTSTSKYWKEVRDFWCDLTEIYNGDMLRTLVLKRYNNIKNKLPEEKLTDEVRIELQKTLITYETLCREIKSEFFKWVTECDRASVEYKKRFANSLLNIPFKYDFSVDLFVLMELKKEYDDWFVEIGVPYKANPINIKLKGKLKNIQTLFNKGAVICQKEMR